MDSSNMASCNQSWNYCMDGRDAFSLSPTLGKPVGALLSEFRLIDIDTNHFYTICLFIRIAFLLTVLKSMMHCILNFPVFRLLFSLQEIMKCINYFLYNVMIYFQVSSHHWFPMPFWCLIHFFIIEKIYYTDFYGRMLNTACKNIHKDDHWACLHDTFTV